MAKGWKKPKPVIERKPKMAEMRHKLYKKV